MTVAVARAAGRAEQAALTGTEQRGRRSRFPARPAAESWPATGQDRAEVLALVAVASAGLPESRIHASHRRGLPVLLDWLEEQPGRTWQQRWLVSGADAANERWAAGPARWLRCRGIYSASRLELMTSSLLVLVGADVIRPSLAWLLTGGKKRKLARNMICSRDPGGFARLRQLCQDDPAITPAAQAKVVFRSAVIIAAKGGVLADVTIGDVLEVLDAERAVRARRDSGAATFRVLREMGIFGPGVATLREILDTGQRTVEELVDRYPIACRPVRDLIVDYLKERQPSIDYVTLQHRASQLARSFWTDLEQHHPGIDTLRLPRDVASAWKQRLRTRSTTATSSTGEKTTVTIERLSYLDTLASVRAFYLDLAEWALDDPARWGPWVARCPIRPEDLERRKFTRRRKARMDARTRDRLPVLPVLARTAARWRDDAQALLAAARLAGPGQEFTAARQTLVRAARPHGDPRNVWARDPATGRQRLLNREEDHAFWAWAIIEVLRSTGIRAEELLELSHHSLVQYRLPGTGELVPLVQIAPSKTDAERLLVVSPELAEVLSTIICRVRGSDEAVPLVRARDRHELIWLPPSPLLFQRRTQTENHAITGNFVADRLDDALARTGLTDHAAGGPLRFTPHDFRRLFITDAILTACRRTSPRSSPATRTSPSPWATRPSTPRKPSEPTWRSWPGGGRFAPPRNTGSPPTRNGRSSSATSSCARSPSASAAVTTQRHVRMKTLVSDVPSCGSARPRCRAWKRSARTSPTGSRRPGTRAGSARSPRSRPPWPPPRRNWKPCASSPPAVLPSAWACPG